MFAALENETYASFEGELQRVCALALARQRTLGELPTIASPSAIEHGLGALPCRLPAEGEEMGLGKAMDVLLDTVVPSLAQGQAGPRYFGFVTGGTLPSALLADMVVSMLDSNVQVHLPKETLSTVVEHLALNMLLDLLDMDRAQWSGTFTTGATSSNMLALSCARYATVRSAMNLRVQRQRGARHKDGEKHDVGGEGTSNWDPAEDGYTGPDVPPVTVFVSQAHASVEKSAAILGIGRKNVVDVGYRYEDTLAKLADTNLTRQDAEIFASTETVAFDLKRLEAALEVCHANQQAAIVVMGMGEVVTGALSNQTLQIRRLCDQYGAWLHMDAAFSAFVCLHKDFKWVSTHMNVCDSVTSDAHKTLNVPYDCGILFVKKNSAINQARQSGSVLESSHVGNHACYLDDLCGPSRTGGGASYLAAAPAPSSAPTESVVPKEASILTATLLSPLHRNVENSRRFRALPVYITLLSQGHRGIRLMVERHLRFAQQVRAWLHASPHYQVLTPSLPAAASASCSRADDPLAPEQQRWQHEHWGTTVVLFRAHPATCPVAAFRDPQGGHLCLIQAIKQTRKIYVSPGGLCGLGAIRLAVSNWYTGVDGDNDFQATTEALTHVMEGPASFVG